MDLLLVAETIENRLLPSHQDLIAVADHFQALGSCRVGMLIPGKQVGEPSKTLAEIHGMDVIAVENEKLNLPHPYLVIESIKAVIQKYSPAYICLPHTMRACQVAAALAHATGSACITAVEDIRMENDSLLFRRSLVNGKLLMDLTPQKSRTILTVLSGSFPFRKETSTIKRGHVEQMDLPLSSGRFTPMKLLAATEKDQAVEAADVIVSAGRGVGKVENMARIREFAGILQNSAVAGSRAVCDLGWLPYSRQIGETGKQVSPKVYLACGISGARQHTAGIKNAQTVIAINTDPHAVIFSVADIGIVEDVTTFLPLLVSKHRQRTES